MAGMEKSFPARKILTGKNYSTLGRENLAELMAGKLHGKFYAGSRETLLRIRGTEKRG